MRNRDALAIVISCLGTALCVACSGQGDVAKSDVVGAVEKQRSAVRQPRNDKHDSTSSIYIDLPVIRRADPDSIRTSSLFQAQSWYTTPSPPEAGGALAPSQLNAPQLPFTFIGRMIDGNDVILFLSRNNQQYSVRANDVLDDTYRLDKITDSDAELIYLPQNIRQSLSFDTSAAVNSSLAKSTPLEANPPPLRESALLRENPSAVEHTPLPGDLVSSEAIQQPHFMQGQQERRILQLKR